MVPREWLVAEGNGINVHAVAPEIDAGELLAGAQFVDAYRVAVGDATLDARAAAERVFGHPPAWIGGLMSLRNRLVAPLGLRTPNAKARDRAHSVGIFPIVSSTPARLVAGFNDRHLDFRVVVDACGTDGVRHVTVTTLVLTHNRLGRVYLAIVLPFHRLIVRSLLGRLGARARQ